MSKLAHHEGIHCNFCHVENFSGHRYKCLVCYDYDICSKCYDLGVYDTPHRSKHPMQCILTPADYDLYYGGEVIESTIHPLSYTCSYCGKMGYTISTLYSHVTHEHKNAFEDYGMVLCPICAISPRHDNNFMTGNLSKHLRCAHNCQAGSGDIILLLHKLGPGSEADPDNKAASKHSKRNARRSRTVHYSLSGCSFDNIDYE